MKSQSIIIAIILASRMTHAQDFCHFTKVEIPRDEARLLELARVIEFRCDSILPEALINKRTLKGAEFMVPTKFIAERYQGGKCVSRQCFSLGMYSSDQLSGGSYKGIISFGWNMDDQKLVGVHDTGYAHHTGYANLPEFDTNRPGLWVFFKDSQAERRTSNGGLPFDLYPIIGIRGSKPFIINGDTISVTNGSDFYSLPSDQMSKYFKAVPDGVIVYLYFGGGSPQLDYDNKEAESGPGE